MIKPIHDYAFVEPIMEAALSSTLIEIPEGVADQRLGIKKGKVLAMGEGRRCTKTGALIPVQTKVGDFIIYSQVGSVEVTADGIRGELVSEYNILLILEEKMKPLVKVKDPRMKNGKPYEPISFKSSKKKSLVMGYGGKSYGR